MAVALTVRAVLTMARELTKKYPKELREILKFLREVPEVYEFAYDFLAYAIYEYMRRFKYEEGERKKENLW